MVVLVGGEHMLGLLRAAEDVRSPRLLACIAEVVAAQAAERGFRRLGLLGTRWLVDSEVYPEKLAARGLQFVRPDRAVSACGPFCPWVISNSTFWFSFSDL